MIAAVDISFLLQLAEADKTAWDTYSATHASDQPWFFVATPAVVGSPDLLLEQPDAAIRDSALAVWQGLSADWQTKVVALDEGQRKVAWLLTDQLLQRGVLPQSQRLEAEVLGEAAIVADALLVADTSPLAQLDSRWLTLECRQLGMSDVCLITTALFLKVLNFE